MAVNKFNTLTNGNEWKKLRTKRKVHLLVKNERLLIGPVTLILLTLNEQD